MELLSLGHTVYYIFIISFIKYYKLLLLQRFVPLSQKFFFFNIKMLSYKIWFRPFDPVTAIYIIVLQLSDFDKIWESLTDINKSHCIKCDCVIFINNTNRLIGSMAAIRYNYPIRITPTYLQPAMSILIKRVLKLRD